MKFRSSKSILVLYIITLCASKTTFANWKLTQFTEPPAKISAEESTQTPYVMAASSSSYGTTTTTNETATSVEIRELARALHYDPLQIYSYVKNHIEYIPSYGVHLGASGCLRAGKGNDFDQSALLIALLRTSGYSCYYRNADVIYKRSDFVQWCGAPGTAVGIVYF